MTEIPEHLLKRARNRRAQAGEVKDSPPLPPRQNPPEPTDSSDNNEGKTVKNKLNVAVGLFGLLGGFLVATCFVWLPVWLTAPFFRGAGHWYSAAMKRAQTQWLTNSFWLWVVLLTLIFSIAACAYFVYDASDSRSRYESRAYKASLPNMLFGGLAVISLFAVVLVSINGAFGFKGKAQYYNQQTYFAVDDINNLPASLQRLVQGGDGVVAYDGPFGETEAIFGTHDVPSIVIQHPLSLEGWQVRNNSYQTAVRQMSRTSGTEPGSQLLADTVTYLPGETTESGIWSGIRDGRGKQSHIKGIITWGGGSERAVNACEFSGQYRLDRALTGSRGNSLNHALFAEVPAGWWYNMEDVYGYCTPDREPVLVFPMIQYVRTNGRALATTADVVLVHGSPNGDPRFERFSSVQPGAIPGPVYPISLSRVQREQANWAAGRKWHDNESFGYDPSNSESQNGNNADYLLKSVEDGRLYWVTPLTPNTSDSQLTIAYSVISADTMAKGELNDLVVYVLADDDERVTDFNRLESNIQTAITRFDSGFFATDGNRLEEFIPGLPGQWTAFAVDSNGIPRYVIDITGGENGVITVREGESGRIVQRLDLSNQVVEEGEAACSADLKSLSDTALIECLDQIQAELAGRLETAND